MKKISFILLLIIGISNVGNAQICSDTVKFSTSNLPLGGIQIQNLSPLNHITTVDYGNGSILNILTPYEYHSNGTYNVCLTSIDTVANCTSQFCLPVEITNAVMSPCGVVYSVYAMDSVTYGFSAYTKLASSVGNELIWDFGNGTIDTTQQYFQQQTFALGNSYNVCLFNVNSLIGCDEAYCKTINLDTNSCGMDYLDFNVDIDQSIATLHFVNPDYLTLIPHFAYSVDWGDGHTDLYPYDGMRHRYSSTGGFDVTIYQDTYYDCFPCDTSLGEFINISTLNTDYCNPSFIWESLGIHNNFISEAVELPGETYEYYWSFDGTYYNLGGSVEGPITYDTAGPQTACLSILSPTLGCADTLCKTIDIEIADIAGPCDIAINNFATLYKDNTYAIIGYELVTTPEGLSLSYNASNALSPTFSGGTYPNYLSNPTPGFSVNPMGTDVHQITATLTGACSGTDTISFIPNLLSYFTCDSVLKDIVVEYIAENTYRVKAILHDSIMNNVNVYDNCYNLAISTDNAGDIEYSLKNVRDGVIIYIPVTGSFSLSAQVISECAPACIADRQYFNITDTSANTPALCDAYFELEADTTGPPDSWALFNLSTGSNLSYSWDFGDGNTSTSFSPYHHYATPDYYVISLEVRDTINGCHDTYCSNARSAGQLISQLISGNLLINDQVEPASHISVFPNPSSSLLYIKYNDSNVYPIQYSIFQPTGSVVKMGQYNGVIQIEDLPSGIYMMKIETANHYTEVKKIIISK